MLTLTCWVMLGCLWPRAAARNRTSAACLTATQASALSMQIGMSIGVTPRFVTAHSTHTRAVNGRYKRFTDLMPKSCLLTTTRAEF